MQVRRYDLDLDVDFAAERFRGHVDIHGDGPAGRLTLDCGGLEIRATLQSGKPLAHELDSKHQKLHVDGVAFDQGPLVVEYTGAARRDVLNGVYVSKLGDSKLITTMMEPVGCRWLLPCIDEPRAKAVFRVRVTTASGLEVISNGAVESTTVSDGRATWSFAPTPPMSTYLVYLGVGPLETRELVDDGVLVIVAAASGQSKKATPVLEMAGPILRGYREYFGIGYPLPKLHLVAVPELWAGGMENWGAIVIPELGLLWDQSTSPAVVRWAVETITHEIAHQWFGNLVTMDTFNDLWLNESFTTFVAARMEERLKLRSDPWAEFCIRTASGYFIDSLRSTHPVQLHLRDPSEISQSTDEITYFKGANIVRMIERFLGEDTFRAGLRVYFDRFQYANARSEDLWQALEEASHQPVRRWMAAWVDRPGLPVVRVHQIPAGLRLEQSRFSFGAERLPDPPWPIPLRFVDGSNERSHVFDGATTELPCSDPARVRLNPERSSFIRVWYDLPSRRARLPQLSAWPATDRWAYVNDAAAFVLSGDFSVHEFLEIVAAVAGVEDYPTVQEVLGALRTGYRYLPEHPEIVPAALHFCRAQWARLGEVARPGEPDTDPILRQSLAADLVRLDPEFAAGFAARFPNLDREPSALRPAILLAYARAGPADAYRRLFDYLHAPPSKAAAEDAAGALAGVPSTEVAEAVLSRVLEPGIANINVQHIVVGLAAQPFARPAVWAWMQKHLREYERRGEGSWMLSVLLQGTIPAVGLARPEEVRAYFDTESFPEGSNGIRNGLEMLDVLLRLRSREIMEKTQ